MSFWSQQTTFSELTGNVQFELGSYNTGNEGMPINPLLPGTNAVLQYNRTPYDGLGPYYACTILGVYIETKNSAPDASFWATGTFAMYHLDNTGSGTGLIPFWSYHFDQNTPYFYSIEQHNVSQVCTYALVNSGSANVTPGFYLGFEFRNDNLGLRLLKNVYVSIQYKLTPSFINIL